MDAYVKEIPVAREATSEQAFGAASLQPPVGTDLVPSGIFFRDPGLRPEQQHLLREAYARLLGDGAFPRVLDLLASSDDFVPRAAGLRLTGLAPPTRVAADLRPRSGVACEVTHDVNEQPRLPFDDASFDAVLVTLEVGKLRRPLEVFREVARVLRPQGLVAVSFGPAGYDATWTRLWALADDREHLMLAEAFIEFACAGFSRPTSLTLLAGEHGLAWHEGPPSLEALRGDHAHLVLAYRDAVAPAHLARPPFPPPPIERAKTKDDVRFDEAGRPCCPYCGVRMGRYAPPVTVFEIDYGVSELDVCFDDRCPYYRGSKRWMRAQGHVGYTYRFMLNPETGATGALPDDLHGGLRSCRLDCEEQAAAPVRPAVMAAAGG
ncbi:MAG: hypothetical protein A2V77_21385 [Anaeromyxobacter sp. RBG_16_69_14]|nr:MAG: hypothetical protein A2V77_21385 [Anaeromyxobacter sp. RBG_16_69_14]